LLFYDRNLHVQCWCMIHGVQKDDIIYVLDVFDSGLCHGVLKNHIGVFRLSDVETMPEDGTLLATSRRRARRQPRRARPTTVEELLDRLGLQVSDARCLIFHSAVLSE